MFKGLLMRKETGPLGMESCQVSFLSSDIIKREMVSSQGQGRQPWWWNLG